MSKNSKTRRDRKRRADLHNDRRANGLRQHGVTEVPASRHLSIQVPLTNLGPPGIPQVLHSVASVAGPEQGVQDTHDQNRRLIHDATEREFRVLVHLAKEPGSFSPDALNLASPASDGASLVKAAAKGEALRFQTSFGTVDAVMNRRQEIAALEFVCRASGWRDMLRKYSELVAPLIDHISFTSDVPVFVRLISWEDIKNKVAGASYVPPYAAVGPAAGGHEFDLQLRALYALYREGLSSGSVFYQFLCFSKILEGVFKWLMPKLRQEAKTRDLPPPKVAPRVQDNEHLEGAAREWIGKSIEQTFNDYIQDKFRNAIAHFAADDQDPIVTSDYFASGVIAENLFLARHCAHRAVEAAATALREMKVAVHGEAPPMYSLNPLIGG